MMIRKRTLLIPLLGLLMSVLWMSNLLYGNVSIPLSEVVHILTGQASGSAAWQHIVLQSRLPQAITALLAGASLAASGLLLQTLFKNPLAGPSILGISDGANLGVAFVLLLFGSAFGSVGGWAMAGAVARIVAAFAGALAVLGLVIYFSTRVQSNVMLLIIGIMIGYLASSVIAILNYYAAADRIRAFVLWGMGDFSSVSSGQLPIFVGASMVGLAAALLLIKPLDALLLGDRYAANLGVPVRTVRILILLSAGLLTATVTAFCGPVSFIGLAVPHVARLLLGTSGHRLLMPVTLLTGACMALLCNLISVMPLSERLTFPLNAVTPLLGAPVIIYVIMNRRNIRYFN